MTDSWSAAWQSEDDCARSAQSLAPRLRGGMSLGLSGTLGAGKTTFVRHLAVALGSADVVTSPTYILQHEYRFPGGILEHWDLYRLTAVPDELWEPLSADRIRLVEWYDMFPELASQISGSVKIVLEWQQEQPVRTVYFSLDF